MRRDGTVTRNDLRPHPLVKIKTDPEFRMGLVVVIPDGRAIGGVEQDSRIHRRDVAIAEELIIVRPVSLRERRAAIIIIAQKRC